MTEIIDWRCRCGHTEAEHWFDGWGQPFGCLAHTYDGPMGQIICECATWEPRLTGQQPVLRGSDGESWR